jgi:hypothetical protein
MYISINADGTGNKFGELASQDNEEGISNLSSQLKEAHAMIDGWVQSNGGKVIASSGDENLFFLQNTEGLEQLLSDYSEHTQSTITVGMGETISQAIKAMIYGKSQGQGTTNQYSPEMESSLNGEQQEEAGNPEQELPNDSATPPEQDPTNQIVAPDQENQEMEGNGVSENGGPQVGGPVDLENGVEPVSPIPMDQEQTAPEPKQAAGPQSVIPQNNSVQSQQKQPTQNPFGAKKADPIGNSTSTPSIVPNKDAAPVAAPQPPQNIPNSGNLPTQKVPESNVLPTDNSQTPEKTVEMPVDSLVDEHEELVDTLESPSHEDDQKEAQEQGSELEGLKEIQNEDGQQEGELTGVMDSQIGDENAQDGVQNENEQGQDAENTDVHDSMNTEDSVNKESEDGVDVESLRNEIAQNLLTFKENKQFFEESKQTNPKLYLATISLLRNMIQMAKKLGLTPGKDMDQMNGSMPENNDIQTEAKDSSNSEQKTDKPFPPKKENAQNAPEEGKNAPNAPEKDSGFPPKKDDKKEETKKPDFGKK